MTRRRWNYLLELVLSAVCNGGALWCGLALIFDLHFDNRLTALFFLLTLGTSSWVRYGRAQELRLMAREIGGRS